MLEVLMPVQLGLALLSVVLLGIFVSRSDIFKNRNALQMIPGFKGTFLLGNVNILPFLFRKEVPILASLFDILNGMAVIFREDGLFRIQMGSNVFVCLTSPKYVQMVTKSQTELNKGFAYAAVKEYFGDGLIVVDGNSKWRRHRKILNGGFKGSILNEHYFPAFDQSGRQLAEVLRNKVNQDFVKIYDLVVDFTFDIFMVSGMGVAVDKKFKDEYRESLNAINEAWVNRPLHPWFQSDFVFNLTSWGKEFRKHTERNKRLAKQIIERKKREIEKGETEVKDFMDFILKLQGTEQFSEEDILDEVNTFIGTGYDTTSVTVAWALYLIGLHDDVQEKIRNELDEIFGGPGSTRNMTFNDLNEMKYLESVIKESDRLYPGVPLISRELQNDMEIAGMTIPKGTNILINVWDLHHNPDYFPNPEKFQPDRIFSEQAYMPFSFGPRNCIGQKFAQVQQKVMIANILRWFEVKSLDPPDKVLYIPQAVGWPHNDLRIKVTSRRP